MICYKVFCFIVFSPFNTDYMTLISNPFPARTKKLISYSLTQSDLQRAFQTLIKQNSIRYDTMVKVSESVNMKCSWSDLIKSMNLILLRSQEWNWLLINWTIREKSEVLTMLYVYILYIKQPFAAHINCTLFLIMAVSLYNRQTIPGAKRPQKKGKVLTIRKTSPWVCPKASFKFKKVAILGTS